MLSIKHLTKFINETPILKDITCDLGMGNIVALLGPSGSGKTTLLRCIGRLEEYQNGTITFNDQEIHTLEASQIGLVFQSFNLFPHMTVMENLCYAPKKLNGASIESITIKALKLLENFGLSDKAGMFPIHLSGGQKQRVAIARTLMLDPQIILFDEPTSALDPEMVNDVADIIEQLKTKDRLIIMATHELRICELIADRVLFLDQGKLIENQTKSAFFKTPKSERAKIFIEKMG